MEDLVCVWKEEEEEKKLSMRTPKVNDGACGDEEDRWQNN